MKARTIFAIITSLVLFGATTGIYLYTAGYRLDRERSKIDLTQTGMIGAKSIPEGAKVYIDGQLVDATNSTIPGISPGSHTLMIMKNGFVTWSKSIEVFPELVTDITAILVSQSPRLEPLTNTGARFLAISPSLSRLAFFTKDGVSPGVWVIPLTNTGLSLFRSNAYAVLEDKANLFYSDGVTIEWSPDERRLLVLGAAGDYYMVDLDSKTAEATSSPELLRTTWEAELKKKRSDFIVKADLSEELKEIATDTETIWAPDDKKFLYTRQVDGSIEYRVYNMEKPLPIGERVETTVFVTKAFDPQPKVSWYADSFHLVLFENYSEEAHRGTISLIRIDGTNKTEVYNNSLYSDLVYSAPGGDKLIILTTLKSGGQTDLYTVGIR
ncbi:PEGA domain-containing protein [candidate division WWE3 bacterium]|nr:PEGA domain-containing protein [candidate division WWE3 bacterium]